MKLTTKQVQADLDALPEGYKTGDVDGLIRRYVQKGADVSELREHVLTRQQFHRIYFHVSLEQRKTGEERLAFIHENLLFSDWWHTDELIRYVADVDFDLALDYGRIYQSAEDPFVRRWGYVLFISRLCRGHGRELLPLMKDDEHYYVQMGQSWLIAELAMFEPELVYDWFPRNGLSYRINGKAIQKICDSYRISGEWKERFRSLRPALKRIP